MLFHGPSGIGKATLAKQLAQALLCPNGGCGQCDTCHLCEAGNHPDLSWVSQLLKKSSKSEYSKQIVVDQIRSLASLVGIAPRMGVRRVLIIDPADAMNSEAQNALLKTLEEPPSRVSLILVAARPQTLVPTVRSRCFSLGFAPLRTEELARLLIARGIDEQEAQVRAALAGGRVGEALELDIERSQALRESLLELLERFSRRKNLDSLPNHADSFAGKDDGTLLLHFELALGLLRDAARLCATGDELGLVHQDIGRRLQLLGEQLGAQRCAQLVAAFDKLRDQLRFNLNRKLVAETFLAAVAGGPLP
jgi:DNA polymerase-3 subunit delta'